MHVVFSFVLGGYEDDVREVAVWLAHDNRLSVEVSQVFVVIISGLGLGWFGDDVHESVKESGFGNGPAQELFPSYL